MLINQYHLYICIDIFKCIYMYVCVKKRKIYLSVCVTQKHLLYWDMTWSGSDIVTLSTICRPHILFSAVNAIINDCTIFFTLYLRWGSR